MRPASRRPGSAPPWPSWRVICAGVCGTDRMLAKRPVRPGVILGHEVVCADDSGKVYALNNEIPCGRCRYCREGHASHCLHLLELGVNEDGGFSRELRAPAANLHPIRVRDPRTGILVEPMACALHGAMRLAGLLAGSEAPPKILLLGAGVSGRLLALALRERLPAAELSVHDARTRVPGWAPPMGAIAGYNLYMSKSSGSGYVKVNDKPITGWSYPVSSLDVGERYYFILTSLSRDTPPVESRPSPELSRVATQAAPLPGPAAVPAPPTK